MAVHKEAQQEFNDLNDVAAERNGGRILFATDDFFAVAENLIKDTEPVWKEGEYTEFGKWMDGWETRRRRSQGHDYCILQLAAPAVLNKVLVNTAYFTGNHAPRVSIQAACIQQDKQLSSLNRTPCLGSAATYEALSKTLHTEEWTTIMPVMTLNPGYPDSCQNTFSMENKTIWTHIRLNLFPDGGVARLRVFGKISVPQPEVGKMIDLASFVNGGTCISYSDAHFGHPRNLLRPGRGTSMADGWETARRLDRPAILTEDENGVIKYSGQEWCVLQLGVKGQPVRVEVDTNHFKGNFPDRVKLEAGVRGCEGVIVWQEILPFHKVEGHTLHNFPLTCSPVCTLVKLTLVPDGGISRLRVFGQVVPD